jgi:hypothetical protein
MNSGSVPGDPPVQVTSVEPRIFGVIPPFLALSLGLIGIAVGISVAFGGQVLAGAVAVGVGAFLVVLAIDAARRWPTSAIPRAAVKVADGLGSRAGLARVSAGAWSESAREVMRLGPELRALRSERAEAQSALGAAAYEEERAEMKALRDRIRELDGKIEEGEQRMTEVRKQGRRRIERKKAAIKPTEAFAVPESPPGGDDAKTRTAPTAIRPPSR